MLLPYCHFLLVWEHIPLITIGTDQGPTRALHSLAFDMCQVFFFAVAGRFVMFSCCPQGPIQAAAHSSPKPPAFSWKMINMTVTAVMPLGVSQEASPTKLGSWHSRSESETSLPSLQAFSSNALRSLKNEFLLPGREVEEPPEPFRVVILLKVWDSSNSWSIMNINKNTYIYISKYL